MEKNRLGLSLLEEDTGVPESVDKKFRKCPRILDTPSNIPNASAGTAAKKSVKRKADADLVDDAGSQTKMKRAKVERITASSKKVKEVSLYY